MIWACKSQRGVTLIELLVVIAIMMSLLTLVAPYGINMVDKTATQTERIRLRGMLKNASHQAFISASPVKMVFFEQTVEVHGANRELTQHVFEHLYFSEPQTLLMNRNGFPGLSRLLYQTKSQPIDQPLDLSFLSTLQRDQP